MKFYSLNGQVRTTTFAQSVHQGLANDKGLFFPSSIPVMTNRMMLNLKTFSKEEIAYFFLKQYLGSAIHNYAFKEISSKFADFPIPLVQVSDSIYSMELFHGPTLAFKDVGARFMSLCLDYFSKKKGRRHIVLVATSGDTGGAVANGFLGVKGIEVVILYPKNRVSEVQERQLTTLGQNIHALEVEGTFDDCQRMVKEAFTDRGMPENIVLTSANSINVARWLPQQLYFYLAYKEWPHEKPPVFSVPSGNFGNISAGLLAHFAGVPSKHFIAACNANDTIPRYMDSGTYAPRPTIPTVSNAMDVSNPSNFIRIQELFKKQNKKIESIFSSVSVSDKETIQTIKDVYDRYGYITDPHGATAYFALEEYLITHPKDKGIFLETAHPIKFADTVEAAIGKKLDVPPAIQALFGKEMHKTPILPHYKELRAFLLDKKD